VNHAPIFEPKSHIPTTFILDATEFLMLTSTTVAVLSWSPTVPLEASSNVALRDADLEELAEDTNEDEMLRVGAT
jgi:hypothetical protein